MRIITCGSATTCRTCCVSSPRTCGSGHNVVATVFAECHSMYRTDGPVESRSVGEMEFIAGIAAMSDSGAFGSAGVCRAAVGNVDLTLGAAVEPIIDGANDRCRRPLQRRARVRVLGRQRSVAPGRAARAFSR